MSSQEPLPSDAIERVLFICSKVHVYSIPPLTSNKGYVAATWTENNNAREIFTARLRVIETAIPPPASNPSAPEKVFVNVLLEDPKTAELFAGAPYTDKTVVEAAIDSSRFYAVRVVGDGGQKAVLGLGFEDRSESIDFGICLQECRKVLGHETRPHAGGKTAVKGGKMAEASAEKKDWSLKEGETIKIDIGRKGRRKEEETHVMKDGGAQGVQAALFSLKPPPGMDAERLAKIANGAIPSLAPPPSAQEARSQKRRSRGSNPGNIEAKQLGFDDGEFGEFQ